MITLFVLAAQAFADPPAVTKPAAPVKSDSPLRIPGLGGFQRPVTTASAEAQGFFNQGLMLLYAFNHDEAIRAFQEAVKFDPKCAMAHWGIAFANGPHINFPLVPPPRAKAAWAALAEAKKHAGGGTPCEQALIGALAARYADPQPEDRAPLDKAFADAMRKVRAQFPADADVAALAAESVMDLRPWDLWTADGKPQPETPEVLALLDAALLANPNHPLALHLYVHAVEASPQPGKADAAANRLRNVAPGLSHLVHMPSHIDVLRGRWLQAAQANERAITVDVAYRKLSPNQGFYRLYMAHNRHMLMFAAMMSGRSKVALDSARAMLAEIPAEWLKEPGNAGIVDGFHAAPIEVLMRFGKWEEMLKEPEPDAMFPIARALRLAFRGVAFAALKRPEEARKEQAAFVAASAKVPPEAQAGNNKAPDLFAVAGPVLEGEILLGEGKFEEAVATLSKALAAEKKVRYDEPPGWIVPVRHSLGVALLAAGKPADAERRYREDLKRWPNNGWSLLGLAQSLTAQNKPDAAEKAMTQFKTAWKLADVEPPASCFCKPAGK
ncbi:MAG TPA: tetratricopeptide repeat protein [Planctomycetia bacterium]|nr:tetratricopeptide repeat protein [Planctomycetia bacterium]